MIIVSVDEAINHIISECNKQAQREYTTGWERGSTGNCARYWNLTILPNGINPDQNPS